MSGIGTPSVVRFQTGHHREDDIIIFVISEEKAP